MDYNFDMLMGFKFKNLCVDNFEKYYFLFKILLFEIVDIYFNFGFFFVFVEVVVGDGCFYCDLIMR